VVDNEKRIDYIVSYNGIILRLRRHSDDNDDAYDYIKQFLVQLLRRIFFLDDYHDDHVEHKHIGCSCSVFLGYYFDYGA
jgi:hypothetical protein